MANDLLITSKRHVVILACVVGVVTFIIGLLIGLYAPPKPDPDPMLSKLTREADLTVSQRLIDGIDRSNIDRHLRQLTEKPHLSGRPGNYETAMYVRNQWKEQGYDVEMVPYDVLLSYPDDNHNNTAKLVASDGSVLFTSTSRERPFDDEQVTHTEAVQPYNAFAPSGNPEAELVYVNYARDTDFEILTKLNVNVTGKIVIARYGKIFRGNKVQFAHQHGAVGIVLFMDPKDYKERNDTYPNGIWLPPTGVQRGNVVMIKGDQATPGYPATWYTARLNQEELNAKLPQIPCHPIGYGDAYHLLREMSGAVAPSEWQGGLNITYRIGGTMKDDKKVKLDVRNHLETVAIYNVFAKMKGTVERDKMVLMGNHRDAWVYGGTDPSSGTATMLEMSRVYAEQVQNGWEPRRSVIFCSWDAEEFGLVGSYEWVEDNVKWLQTKAVAYLNVDSATTGNYTVSISATPSLKQAVYRATKKVPYPHQAGKMLFDIWKEREPDPQNPGYPSVKLPGAGTDYVPFEQDVAVPTTSIGYMHVDVGNRIYTDGDPLYHTLYDSYRNVKMIDPELRLCKAVGAYLLELTRDLIDSPILPMDPRDYAKAVDGFVKSLIDAQQETFAKWNITSDAIQSAADNFTDAANNFQVNRKSVNKQDPAEIRMINEKLMTLEKAFQIHTGLPDRKEYKHVLLSPSRANYYSTTTFPGMADLLYQIGDDATRWERVRKHLSVLTFTIQSAAKILMS